MANYATTGLLSKCAPTVSGILCKSATANTTCEYKKVVNSCGQNTYGFSLNVVEVSDCEGEITGASPSGVCVYKVGESASTPFAWGHNMSSPGSVFVCTAGAVTYAAGEYAKFKVTTDNSDGI